jgi:tetratricopeptide (TPR) repeat protein
MVHTKDLPCANLIPFELQGEVFCLKAEDHYLRIYTDTGEALVLFRFRDAVSSLPTAAGLQTHRSYWVARAAVKKTNSQAQRKFLVLCNGLSVPVSRSRVGDLRKAGWLISHRQPAVTPTITSRMKSLWTTAALWRRSAVAGAGVSIGILIGAGLLTSSSVMTKTDTPLSPAEAAFANGWQEYLRDTPASFVRAANHFQRAVSIDREFGKAYGALASLYHSAAVRGWNKQWGQKLHVTYRLAHQNLIDAARHPTAIGHAAEAQALLYRRRIEEAMVESARAIAIDPKNPAGHLWMANSLIMIGLPTQAEGFLDQARLLGHPSSPSTYWARGMAAFSRDDFNFAANQFEQCLELSPSMNPMPLVAAYGHLGRKLDAENIIAKEQAKRTIINPLNLATVMDGMIFRRKEDAKRFINGLRKAGL